MGVTTNYSFPYPSASDPIRVSSDMEDLATAIDTRLLFDSSRNGSSLVLAEAFDATQYVSQVQNTTTATQVMSLPISGAQAGDLYILDYGGSIFNATGANRTFIMDIKLGTTTVFTGTSVALANSTGVRSLQGQIRLHVDTTSAQVFLSDSAVGGGTQFNMNGAMAIYCQSVSTATEDLSTTKNLTMDITLSAASGELFFRIQNYRLMRLRTT